MLGTVDVPVLAPAGVLTARPLRRLEKEVQELETAADMPPATARDSAAARSPARAPAPSPAREAQQAEPALNSQQVMRFLGPALRWPELRAPGT